MSDRDFSLPPDMLGQLLGKAMQSERLQLDPDRVEQDLARLVLGLMAFLRQLMELQAIRRMEAGSLNEDQIEMLGQTLMRAETALHEMAERFDLTPEDLSLDLGPLGRTI